MLIDRRTALKGLAALAVAPAVGTASLAAPERLRTWRLVTFAVAPDCPDRTVVVLQRGWHVPVSLDLDAGTARLDYFLYDRQQEGRYAHRVATSGHLIARPRLEVVISLNGPGDTRTVAVACPAGRLPIYFDAWNAATPLWATGPGTLWDRMAAHVCRRDSPGRNQLRHIGAITALPTRMLGSDQIDFLVGYRWRRHGPAAGITV